MDLKEFEHIAKLSRLQFSPSEINEFKAGLEKNITLISEIEKVEPTTQFKHATVCINSLRNDEVKESLTQNETLKNAPKKESGCFVTPQVVE